MNYDEICSYLHLMAIVGDAEEIIGNFRLEKKEERQTQLETEKTNNVLYLQN